MSKKDEIHNYRFTFLIGTEQYEHTTCRNGTSPVDALMGLINWRGACWPTTNFIKIEDLDTGKSAELDHIYRYQFSPDMKLPKLK